jgi:NAD(P)-dependent dehydrogenase (short-subunit alcohol dehydrogenase family)
MDGAMFPMAELWNKRILDMTNSTSCPFRLDAKVAFVTGAATGIGAAVAVALASQGAQVAISDRPGENQEATLAQVQEHSRGSSFEMDVRQSRQIASAVAAVKAEFGKIDILVNNAGINRPSDGLTISESEWDDHFDTNVKGGFLVAQQVAPDMISRHWGRVIFISSQSGLVGIPGQPAYCATKGAVIQLVRTLGLEWAKFGITVNSVAPTFVETNLTHRRLQQEEFLKFVLGKIPIGRLAEPKEVAYAVNFLASNEAAMVNCHTLCVDGGWTAW